MRPITKIFLLLVVAFIVYVLWPRTPNLAGFDPAKIAPIEVESWDSALKAKGVDFIVQRYQIYANEWGLSPVAALRIAMKENDGIGTLRRLADSSDREIRSLPAFQEKYVILKRQTGRDFDSDTLARDEVAWRSHEIDAANYDVIARPMAEILAGLYGGTGDRYIEIAYNIVSARALLDGATLPEGFSDPISAAEEITEQSYVELKEALAESATEPAP